MQTNIRVHTPCVRYGFNCGSVISLTDNSFLVSRVAVNTTISASSACITAIILSIMTMGIFDVVLLVNGLLSGLVGITSTCAIADPWMACVIGIISCIVYASSRCLLVRLRIDDPMEAASVHGFVGTWGLLAAGIFCTDSNVAYVYTGEFTPQNRSCATGEQFGLQLVGALCILAWTCGMSFLAWQAINYTLGLRVVPHVEEMGLDVVEHGRSAFAERRPFVGWAVESGGMAVHGLGDLKYETSEHGFFSRKYAEVQAYVRSRDPSNHSIHQQQHIIQPNSNMSENLANTPLQAQHTLLNLQPYPGQNPTGAGPSVPSARILGLQVPHASGPHAPGQPVQLQPPPILPAPHPQQAMPSVQVFPVLPQHPVSYGHVLNVTPYLSAAPPVQHIYPTSGQHVTSH
jgi:hypothetical protein